MSEGGGFAENSTLCGLGATLGQSPLSSVVALESVNGRDERGEGQDCSYWSLGQSPSAYTELTREIEKSRDRVTSVLNPETCSKS